MKQKIICLLYTSVILLAAAGCKKDDILQKKGWGKIVQANISGVNGPTSGSVNQELTFNLTWQNGDGTARIDHLIDSSLNNVGMIKLYALLHAVDTTIVAAKAPATISYTFKAATAGTYLLKFYKADNSEKTAIIDTLVIK